MNTRETDGTAPDFVLRPILSAAGTPLFTVARESQVRRFLKDPQGTFLLRGDLTRSGELALLQVLTWASADGVMTRRPDEIVRLGHSLAFREFWGADKGMLDRVRMVVGEWAGTSDLSYTSPPPDVRIDSYLDVGAPFVSGLVAGMHQDTFEPTNARSRRQRVFDDILDLERCMLKVWEIIDPGAPPLGFSGHVQLSTVFSRMLTVLFRRAQNGEVPYMEEVATEFGARLSSFTNDRAFGLKEAARDLRTEVRRSLEAVSAESVHGRAMAKFSAALEVALTASAIDRAPQATEVARALPSIHDTL